MKLKYQKIEDNILIVFLLISFLLSMCLEIYGIQIENLLIVLTGLFIMTVTSLFTFLIKMLE